ncbi:STM4015 family protein [Anaerosinus massiliensis]|uniref:STM4015 family protein n=1 Tax=Massilibacillus massiliensis TaxID=1806837 RepID=UPI000ACA1108|nr:STM4015 family protein [Massilibacillus massiliensis]
MEEIKFYVDYDEEETLVEKLAAYIEEHGSYALPGLIIGNWTESYEQSPEDIIAYLVENKAKFPNLKKIFLGDMDSEECEISWIIHTDAGALVNEFQLEELIIKGASGLRLKDVSSDTLKKLTMISGGLSAEVLEDVVAAKIPNLEHLELYLGVDEYGFDGSIATLEPFMKRSNFPKIKYLGLKNSELADEICEKIFASDILPGLEVLDMSLGTLSDTGASIILEKMEQLRQLKTLDLTYNYVSDELLAKITAKAKAFDIEVLCSKEDVYIDEDDEFRYPYFTE